MREILFRGKRIDNGEWVEGYLYVTHLGEYEIGNYNEVTNIERWTAVVDPYTVGQYIGKRDKHGKRIFVGDIVDGRLPVRCEVVWCEHSSAFLAQWVSRTAGEDLYVAALYGTDGLEVIGNVHDTPALLEGGVT